MTEQEIYLVADAASRNMVDRKELNKALTAASGLLKQAREDGARKDAEIERLKRTPLTEPEMEEIIFKVCREAGTASTRLFRALTYEKGPYEVLYLALAAKQIVWDIEAAHGIGEQTNEPT